MARGVLTESSRIFSRVLGCSSYGVQAQVLWPVGLVAPLRVISHFPSGTTRCLRHILHIPCPSSRISHFSEEPYFLFLENDKTKIQVLSELVAMGMSLLLGQSI